MYAALVPYAGMQPLLVAMPARLRMLAVQASIDEDFDASIHLAREAVCVADTLPRLKCVTAVRLDFGGAC